MKKNWEIIIFEDMKKPFNGLIPIKVIFLKFILTFVISQIFILGFNLIFR
jgi:hypothetical protein